VSLSLVWDSPILDFPQYFPGYSHMFTFSYLALKNKPKDLFGIFNFSWDHITVINFKFP
jgi:hypothetical protein